MDQEELLWEERTSESEFIASVWTCSTPVATVRTVLADPCIALSLLRGKDGTSIVIKGPRTKPHAEQLAAGYTCTAIRLQPGVLLKDFPVEKFINRSLTLPADAASWFWRDKTPLSLPDFDHAEQLVEQLRDLGSLNYDVFSSNSSEATSILSRRTHLRQVKRTTGLSPYRLHQLQRIHRALRLLKQGMPAIEVAAELDFVDQSHLTHASKQFLGHTPKQLLRLPQTP